MRSLVLIVLVAGCKGPVTLDDVRKEFSQSNTCPVERVEARERPELKPSQLDRNSSPPAEIAADPGRLPHVAGGARQAERVRRRARPRVRGARVRTSGAVFVSPHELAHRLGHVSLA
jgi:hypothetical protein